MSIQRGDVWLVNLEPTIGAEIRKTRPVVVVSSVSVGVLPIRLVVLLFLVIFLARFSAAASADTPQVKKVTRHALLRLS